MLTRLQQHALDRFAKSMLTLADDSCRTSTQAVVIGGGLVNLAAPARCRINFDDHNVLVAPPTSAVSIASRRGR